MIYTQKPSDKIIGRVRDDWGFLSNMSAHPVTFKGIKFHTTEHLFQSLRFFDKPEIVATINKDRNPMTSKLKAREIIKETGYVVNQDDDITFMKICLNIKCKQYPEILKKVLDTGLCLIVEDVSSRWQKPRAMFWGMRRVDGMWEGENKLGALWMEIRENGKPFGSI